MPTFPFFQKIFMSSSRNKELHSAGDTAGNKTESLCPFTAEHPVGVKDTNNYTVD